MKRLRSEEDFTKWLMLLSRGTAAGPAKASSRVFECKTCNRHFGSFQALGGHRASHKRSRAGEEPSSRAAQSLKPRVHECPICGLEFGIGQALGGHMRRHRNVLQGCDQEPNLVKTMTGVGVLSLDLNLPPPEIFDLWV